MKAVQSLVCPLCGESSPFMGDRCRKCKNKARRKVAWAIEVGELIRPQHCGNCRLLRRIEAHHEDYDKPLDVEWLCRRCHDKRHHARLVYNPA